MDLCWTGICDMERGAIYNFLFRKSSLSHVLSWKLQITISLEWVHGWRMVFLGLLLYIIHGAVYLIHAIIVISWAIFFGLVQGFLDYCFLTIMLGQHFLMFLSQDWTLCKTLWLLVAAARSLWSQFVDTRATSCKSLHLDESTLIVHRSFLSLKSKQRHLLELDLIWNEKIENLP